MLRSCADPMAGSAVEVSPVVPHAIQAATALQDPVTRGLTIYGEPLPPLPMTRKEARAQGLKTYPGQALCRRDGTNIRRTRDGQCVACLERTKAEQEARERAIREEERARVLKSARAQVLRQLAAEERQRQREAEQARKEAERATARAQRESEKKERRRQKAAATWARNKAAREAASAAPAKGPTAPQAALASTPSKAAASGLSPWSQVAPPWEDTPAGTPATAPALVEVAPPWEQFADFPSEEDDSAPWD